MDDLRLLPLEQWPLEHMPNDWVAHVNEPQSENELAALQRSVQRSCPYGSEGWQTRIATELGLASSLRPQGRPRKVTVTIPQDLRQQQPAL
jgi:putative transposase